MVVIVVSVLCAEEKFSNILAHHRFNVITSLDIIIIITHLYRVDHFQSFLKTSAVNISVLLIYIFKKFTTTKSF